MSAFTAKIRPFRDRPDIELDWLFYKVPFWPYAQIDTPFTDRFWDDREGFFPTGIGISYKSMKPYFGPLPPIPGLPVPKIGTDDEWKNGLLYSKWVTGGYGNPGVCWPLYDLYDYPRINQVQAINVRQPVFARWDERQTVETSVAVAMFAQVQAVYLVVRQGAYDQVQTVTSPAGVASLNQVQLVNLSAKVINIDQVQGVGISPSLDQVQTITSPSAILLLAAVQAVNVTAATGGIQQVQGITSPVPICVADQVQGMSVEPGKPFLREVQEVRSAATIASQDQVQSMDLWPRQFFSVEQVQTLEGPGGVAELDQVEEVQVPPHFAILTQAQWIGPASRAILEQVSSVFAPASRGPVDQVQEVITVGSQAKPAQVQAVSSGVHFHGQLTLTSPSVTLVDWDGVTNLVGRQVVGQCIAPGSVVFTQMLNVVQLNQPVSCAPVLPVLLAFSNP